MLNRVGMHLFDALGQLREPRLKIMCRKVMPDLLHPNANGYQIWADGMQGKLEALMK